MSQRREEWRKVLDSEVERWSAKSCERLVSELRDLATYQVEFDSKKYQVEVKLLENTEKYVHVMVAVDDGSLPASLLPLMRTFICEKALPGTSLIWPVGYLCAAILWGLIFIPTLPALRR